MDIEFIKWMVGYAEGFECEGDQICNPANYMYTLSNFDAEYKKDLWEFTDYPLLLQRAIEGINRKKAQQNEGFWIIQDLELISVHKYNRYIEGYLCSIRQGLDHAKEQALKYIYEQEKKEKS